MHRPDSLQLKARLDFDKTWTRLYRLWNNPASIRPAALPEHLESTRPAYSFKLPQLRGNVRHTMWEIMAIFMADWRRSARAITTGIRTTCTSLAKRCSNRDPKTAYRHILTLIEHGFLRAKVHVRSGLQLLINPAVLVFDAAAAAVAPAPQPAPSVAPAAPQAPTSAPAPGLASLLALAAQFTAPALPAFLKNSTRA